MITVEMTVATYDDTLPMDISSSMETLDMSIGAAYEMTSGVPYEGEYEITPRVYAQSLDTDGKLMTDDVTVYGIPVTRTSNPEGGLTVLIG